MKRRGILSSFSIFFGLIATVVLAQSQHLPLVVESNFQDTYQAGSEHEFHLSIRLEDHAERVEQGVVFLNVVENDPSRNYPQAGHRVFESGTESEKIFQVPFEGQKLREGIETTLRIRFRSDAPPGDYVLVFQVFEGDETNPNRVQVENRVALRAFNFSIVP